MKSAMLERNSPRLEQCNHEEADTRVLFHLLHALQTFSPGMVHTLRLTDLNP